ncbi:hypothetical protein HO173_007705 [Letharia columbiana]|uniref:OTU domain-containing protein n=1 Tax=Letharia columbiana TaxID=112416 RepID=A0A8H6FT77_9LECA|nr:uncharacterized protein HO173_007705 [Letharia columbiana]KAF6234283.1 hypothetical protein HO173_007705 [Letharia columbiana]
MMEDLQRKHRQEQKDLQSRTTQKKKSTTKKTRKGVNDECTELERQLKEKHDAEVAALNSRDPPQTENGESVSVNGDDEPVTLEKPKDISESMNAMSVSVTPATNGHAKKPNRQKARLARRAAEQEAVADEAEKEAADLPNLREKERKAMREAYISRSLKEHEIRSDGHCLYAAVADQLQHSEVGLKPRIQINFTNDESAIAGYKITRRVAAAYISQNPEDFSPFLEEPLDQYVTTIRDTGEWGGHLEIVALAKAYEVDINVLQGDGKVEKIECGIDNGPRTLWLAYYHHSFGLGEHYNSLRKAH